MDGGGAVGVVVNPVAGGGAMRRRWPQISAAITARFGEVTVLETRRPGEAGILAGRLAAEGAALVIAAGGDGTISEAVDGLVRARLKTGRSTDLGIVPVGTGSDLARGLGMAGDVVSLVDRMATADGRPLDAGLVEFLDDGGRAADRHFINIASLGLSGPTDRAVNAAKSALRRSGQAVFLWHTVRELLRYRFQTVRVLVDDQAPVEGSIALVAIANAPYFGGGMMIAPDARPDDGLLEIVVVKGVSKFALLKDFRLVYGGAHRRSPSCLFLRGRRIRVEPLGDPAANAALIDIDGESPGRIPATFTVMPGAVTLRY